MDTEEILIEKATKGDEESFAKLIDCYKNYIFAIILNFIKDYNEVENISQEVFLQIYISLPKYDQKNFKGWIGRIASNKSIDWIRKKKAKFDEEVKDLREDSKLMEDEKDNPEILLLEKENKDALMKIIHEIPDIYSTTLQKFYFEEKSYQQIAEEEDLTVKTIASRLYRAKILLKEKWREKHGSL